MATHLSSEWYEMMFAQAENVDIPDNDHFVVILRKHRIIDNICQTLFVAFGHPHEGLGVPLWRAQQALSCGVLAYTLQDRPDRAGQDLEVRLGFRLGRVEALLC